MIPSLDNITITQAKPLSKGHPVYLVNYNDGGGAGRMVVKCEVAPVVKVGDKNTRTRTDNRYSIEYMAHLYANVAGGVSELRVLTQPEMPIVRTQVMPAGDPRRADSFFASSVFCAMPMLDNLVDLAAVYNPARASAEDKRKAQAALVYLHAQPAAFRGLGRIAVVDFFVGNGDRFINNGTWRILNYGNIFVTWTARGPVRFLGIDFYDPYSAYNNLFDTVAACLERRTPRKPWEAIGVLGDGDSAVRDAFAREVIANFSTETKAFAGAVFDARHAKELRAGLREGRDALKKLVKQDLKQGYYQPGRLVPAGIASRVLALHW